MKRLLLMIFSTSAFALAPTLSASAMPIATPGSLGGSDAAIIQVKGGQATVTVIWGGAAEVIITDGVKGGDIITAGGIIATK